jgi:RNA polymerase sigma-70 factor, ECF subfamily
MNGKDRIPDAPTQPTESAGLAAAFAAEFSARARVAQLDFHGATAACRELYTDIVGCYCMAALGDTALVKDVEQDIWCRLEAELSTADLTRTVRSVVLGLARRRCARLLETTATRMAAAAPDRAATEAAQRDTLCVVARRLLARLRPSDRELLILRYVCNLTYAEIGPLWETSESDARSRLSQALVRATAIARGEEPSYG